MYAEVTRGPLARESATGGRDAPLDAVAEARRQLEICNACRYCEGYCSVFPAVHRQRTYSDGDVVQLANLCHNCRGCYYACQYTPPHEFALNLPKALAEVRQDSWQAYAAPAGLARAFHRSGVAVAVATVVGFALLIWAAKAIGSAGGEGVYATSPDELSRAVNAAMDSGKPTLVNAVIDETAGTESGRIGNLNPQSVVAKK